MALELLKTHNYETPRPSSSVVLLRDADGDIEVFLQRRHSQSFVLGGAYVFPGGKVDAQDAEWIARLDRPAAELHVQLGEPELAAEEAACLYIAAIRELFEEAGLLLAVDVTPERVEQMWAALRAGTSLQELFTTPALHLQTRALLPWSRWVTPTLSSVGRRRFDTRFFLATVPPGQHPHHDDHEATESEWLTPRNALRQYWEGRFDLAPPQILSLTHLARHRSVTNVFDEARRRTPPCVRPEPHDEEGTRMLCYPGDPLHSDPQQVLPGPTRLWWRNERFEPEAGLAALLGE
jgi:8-oxo-dGTP pyrophosphatase MutT (NUDIX family)